jgi:hypothetical protein
MIVLVLVVEYFAGDVHGYWGGRWGGGVVSSIGVGVVVAVLVFILHV